MPASTDTEPGTAPPPSPLPEGSQGGLSAEDVGCLRITAHRDHAFQVNVNANSGRARTVEVRWHGASRASYLRVNPKGRRSLA